MSKTRRHGTAESLQLRVIPSVPRDFDVEERTLVDTNAASRVARHEGLIPSIAKPSRTPQGTTPPPNVIPFTKPRAIAALAAAHPSSVVINERPAPENAPTTIKPLVSPPATRVATGWTPPGAVPTVKPSAPVQVSPTVYPMPAPMHMPAPVIAQQPVPAPVIPVPALHAPIPAFGWPANAFAPRPQPVAPAVPATPAAITTTRPATQMPVAEALPDPPLPDPPTPAQQWAHYEALGLGKPKAVMQHAAKWIVSAYRVLGFGILTIIVFCLVGYIVNTAFFYMSESWVVPMAVSATDEKVVSLQAQLGAQQTARDRIVDELNQAERTIAAQQIFQAEFAKAIRSDLEGRKSALGRIRALANAASATRASIKNQNSAYASESRRRMAQEYAAGLIDRQAMLSGKFQLAQISSSNLSLAERQAEFETRASELEAQTRSLDAILANADDHDTALSYEVLRIKQEYEASRLDLAKSIESRDTLKASLARQDKLLKSLKQSSYLRAINDGASVAFVPYGNLSKLEKGTSLYACKVGMVFCHHVGEVLEVLPGEVQFKHPHRDKQLRGQMVELKLDSDDAGAAADDVLFVGGKPLLI